MTLLGAKEIGMTELPEPDIARLVVARTFLGELEGCITKQQYTHHIPDKDGKLAGRFINRFEFVDQHIPIAWHYAAIAAEEIVPERFKAKLADPGNTDHNRQHLAHVGNNTIIGAAYDLYLPAFNRNDAIDSARVLKFEAFTHDHLQIDRRLKDGHDYLGGLFSKGLMRLARLKYGLPYTERQENLAFFAGFWHSYPEKMINELPPAKKLLDTYGETFGLNDPGSLLYWLRDELSQKGVDLAGLDCQLAGSDLRLAIWLNHRLAAGDKRASYAPPFLSVLRTMGTGNKPFIGEEFIGQPLSFFEKKMRDENTVSRTWFEDQRDMRAAGFSAFEINWLKLNQVKKLDYLVRIASALATGNQDLLAEKFSNYTAEVVYEAYREKTMQQGERAYLLSRIPQLLAEPVFHDLEKFPPDLVNTIKTVVFEYRNATNLLDAKGQELRQFIRQKGWSTEQFLIWFTAIVAEMKAANKFKVVGRHEQTPENLPVYCVSLGVIK